MKLPGKRGKKGKKWWKQKIEVTVAKHQKTRGGICLSSKKVENYESEIQDEIDPDSASNDKNLLL